jgi:hypothetical protein
VSELAAENAFRVIASALSKKDVEVALAVGGQRPGFYDFALHQPVHMHQVLVGCSPAFATAEEAVADVLDRLSKVDWVNYAAHRFM